MLVKDGWLFMDGAFLKRDVRVQEGRICEIGELTPGADEEVVSCAGRYVVAGLVDIHIHAFGGADCMRGEQDVRRMSRGLLETGVAAFVPTTMSADETQTREALQGIQRVMDRQEPGGARVLGAHMEAPFLAPAFKGAQRGECLMAPSMEAFERMTAGTRCVRMMTLAPELDGACEVISRLAARGVVTCAAHTGATAEQVHMAADAGLTQITHLFNAQTPLHHRKPGVPGAGLADPRISVQIIADGIHLHPDILRIAALCKGAAGTLLISDSMEAAGLPDGSYELGGQKVTVKEGCARLENGVLAGSTLLLHQAVTNMIRLAGISPEVVIPMATSSPADSIGCREAGRIRPGADGVLAVFDSDWKFVRAIV